MRAKGTQAQLEPLPIILDYPVLDYPVLDYPVLDYPVLNHLDGIIMPLNLPSF